MINKRIKKSADPVTVKSELAAIVKIHRQRAGLTQEALALRSGVSYTTLIKVESGAIKNPSGAIITKLARALGVTLDTLLQPRVVGGVGALHELWEDILSTLKTPGDYMCISGVSESRYLEADAQGLAAFIQELR